MSEAGRIRLEAKEQNSACKAVLYSRHCAEQPAQLPPDNDCDDQYTDQRCLVSWQHSLVIADAAIVTLASFKRDSSSSGATSMIFVYLFSRWPILPSVRSFVEPLRDCNSFAPVSFSSVSLCAHTSLFPVSTVLLPFAARISNGSTRRRRGTKRRKDSKEASRSPNQ